MRLHISIRGHVCPSVPANAPFLRGCHKGDSPSVGGETSVSLCSDPTCALRVYRGVLKGFGGPREVFFPHRRSKTAIVYSSRVYRGVLKGFGGPRGSFFSPSKVKNSHCVCLVGIQGCVEGLWGPPGSFFSPLKIKNSHCVSFAGIQGCVEGLWGAPGGFFPHRSSKTAIVMLCGYTGVC